MTYAENLSAEWIENNEFFSFLFSASSVLTWIIIKISLFIILGIISGYLTLIILSPIYAWISEKIEGDIKNISYPFKLGKFIKDVLRAIIIALRNSLLQIGWTIGLFILSFVPGINLFTAPALFLVTAYFYGFSFLDYSHERIGLSMGQSIKEVRSKKYAAVTLGGLFLLCYMIPWVGPFIASMTSFQLVVAATVLASENDENKSEKIDSPDLENLNPESSNQDLIE